MNSFRGAMAMSATSIFFVLSSCFFSDEFSRKSSEKESTLLKKIMSLFVAPSSSSSSSSSRARVGREFLPLLARRVMFVAVALVFASATRSVSAKVYFSETFDGTGMKRYE